MVLLHYRIIFPKLFSRSTTFARKNSTCTVANILEKKDVQVGDKIQVKGWIKSLRKQKENVFVDLIDGSPDKLQIVIPSKIYPEKLTSGASIKAEGALSLSPRGQLELNADNVEIYGECNLTNGYPLAPKKQYAPEYIRQFLHFRPRTTKFASLLRVRNCATSAINSYFQSKDFINIHTPILTSNDCEGAGEIFKVVPDSERLLKSMKKETQSLDDTYFNTKAFLTVSGQLHLEAAAHALGKVYTFGPTFRAENSRSRLHLSEFYMIEAEVAFMEKLNELTSVMEELVKYATKYILDHSEKDVRQCLGEVGENYNWLNGKFPILTYKEAVAILKEHQDKFKEKFDETEGLGKEHELFLVKYCNNTPIFVVNWPKAMKPFYMKSDPENNDQVLALDLLAPVVGEIAGGSLREDDYTTLKSNISDKANLDWYLDLRKFGGVPTGGFGIGFERYLQFLLNIENIKDTIPFPRWPHNCRL